MSESDVILSVENVTNSYKSNMFGLGKENREVKILNNVNFHINEREFFGLVGESGCGKSTLCKAILGLIDFKGKISICGLDRKENKKKISRIVQAVFQDPMSALNPKKTIGFMLEEPLKIHKLGSVKERRRRVDEVLELIGLDISYRNSYPHELSGGQRQRVSIGCALILYPQLIIADEAVSSLDVSVGAQILNLFQDLHDSFGLSLLFVSHNLNLVYYLCDRIAVMYKGEIVEMGDAKVIYNQPLHPYTQMLLSAIPKLDEETQIYLTERAKVPAIDLIETGCKYYSLCAIAKDECKNMNYELKNVAGEKENAHYVNCFCIK